MVKLVQQYFTESAQRFPDKISVSFNGSGIAFAELDRSSSQLARALKKRGAAKGDRVAFCLPKSINSISSILGILKADAIYVPLDSKSPAERVALVVKDADPKLIICDDSTAGLLGGDDRIFNLQTESVFVSSQPDSEIKYQNTAEDVAYLLYTSGSTGKPKGVMITHSNIVNATDWAVEELGLTSADRMSQHPPLHFDLSTFDLYCAFKSGAILFLVPEEISLFPGQLVKFIEENELTVWNSVPSVMVYMSNVGVIRSGRMPTLKKIFFNGEGFPSKFLADWMKIYPDKMFVNMYGPTETTVQCTFYRVPEPPGDLSKLVPIGRACRNVGVFALKKDGTLAQPGEEGELYVGGLGVGKGYWQDAEKTAASFLDFPGKGRVYKTGDLVKLLPDGNYEFIGRQDHQIKIRGYRVELGDIESAIFSLPYVKEAGVITRPAGDRGMMEIAAFVSLSREQSEAGLKADLERLLPAYMVPQYVEIRAALPRTSTGKVDRISLKNDCQQQGKN